MSVTLAESPRLGEQEASCDTEISVVMPCLNEARTVGRCVDKAREALRRAEIKGEVIVADNGSTDGSPEIARRMGPGSFKWNAADMAAPCRQELPLLTADSSLWATPTTRMTSVISSPSSTDCAEGYDLVVGNRFLGGIRPGAMPWLHRYVGNPALTGILNTLYHSPIGNAHCGLRTFARTLIIAWI